MVKVYKGPKAEGTVLETLEVTPKSGSFSTAALKKALADGLYTAVATEPSSLGNPAGTSNAVTFDVDTAPPTVTLNAVSTPSSNTTPSFSGTASESEPVTVKIYKGTKAEGTVLASVEAEVSSRNWSSAALSKGLGNGEYTAQAVEPSSIGNEAGKSEPRTFVVNTEPAGSDVERGADAVEQHEPFFQRHGQRIAAGDGEDLQRLESGRLAGGDVPKRLCRAEHGVRSALQPRSPTATYTAVAEENSSLGNGLGKAKRGRS